MCLHTNLKKKAKKLKAEAQVLMLAYKDKRTPAAAKILIGITIGYLLSPIDLIPDFIPVLGLLDDLIIVPVLIKLSIRLIPEAVLNDAKEELKNNPQQYKKKNWLFAIFIVVAWVLLALFVYKYLAGATSKTIHSVILFPSKAFKSLIQ
jgi:uncharacterized membrane protein YkvA (DUF1232 family)